MTNPIRIFTAAVLAGAFSFGVAAFAMGPITMPVTVPVTPVHASVTTAPVHTNVLKTYRQIREFWLSRAVVR